MYNNNLKNKVEEKNRSFIDEILQTTYASRVQIDLNIEKDILAMSEAAIILPADKKVPVVDVSIFDKNKFRLN